MSLAFNATYYLSTRPNVFNAFVATGGATGQTFRLTDSLGNLNHTPANDHLLLMAA